MLFECMLDDRNLPDSLKVLIGRLQIPLVKVAVLDKSFFSRSSHPARRLLNEIANAAMGWGVSDDHERDNLYVRIDQVVQRLLNDFVDDPAIFSELLADFLAFTQDERRRSEWLVQCVRDAEHGRANSPGKASMMVEVQEPVDQMHPGCWVEFQEDPENTLRCKLVAVIETTGKYIFVNRTGMKVLERSRTDLAQELRNGVARVLDDTLLFERALESVIGNLKRLKRGK
jgi:hypothetical protein